MKGTTEYGQEMEIVDGTDAINIVEGQLHCIRMEIDSIRLELVKILHEQREHNRAIQRLETKKVEALERISHTLQIELNTIKHKMS